jgi:hypothetical protein
LAIILPIIIIVCAGYGLARYTRVDTQSLSQVTTYVLSPCLVFTALVRTDLEAAGGLRLGALLVAQFAVLLAMALGIGRVLRLDRRTRNAMALATVLYNSGNYGLPASLFAFGQEGLRIATVVYVVTAIVAYSAGIYLASAGRNAARQALTDMFRLPLIYAAASGLLVNRAGWSLPLPVWRPLELMGQGAVPLLLIALGVQLARARPTVAGAPLGAVSALRLVASPVLTAALLPAFGISGLAASVAILSTAMPTAVNAFLVAAQFGTAPAFVASAVFVTTVASFVTLSVVLLWLQ